MAIKQKYLAGNDESELAKEINFAITNINERKIYSTFASRTSPIKHPNPMVNLVLNKMSSQIIDWLNEYSDANFESSSSSSLRAAKLTKSLSK